MSILYALLGVAAVSGPTTSSDSGAPAAADPQRGDEIIVTGKRSEGSDNYGVAEQRTATRLPISLRETPQSVSVVTRAQIADFQLNDANQLLATVPGITVQAQETDRYYYSARGFDIQTFQIDGIGLPFAFEVQTGSMDTAIYDRIEVVRGAPGLLSSTGNPSAVINFIRKRPYDSLKASASAQYGSFDTVRLDADVSVPLNASGSIRARGVGVYQDGDSYLDRYHLRRWTGYGIVEADVGPNTVVSAGYGHQDHRSRGAMWGALPLYYTDGTRIDLPRSANTGPDWAGWHVIDRQIFGDITHQLGNGWVAKVSALRRASSENDELFYVYGNPERGAPGGLNLSDPNNPKGIFAYPGAFRAQTRNLTLDAYVTGHVSAFGRDHDVMIGVNRSAQRYGQQSSYDTSLIGAPLTVDGTAFDGSFARPNFPTPFSTDPASSQSTHLTRETAYGLVRLHLADPWKVMVGGNYTHAVSSGYSYGAATNYDRSRFLPFVGTTLDLTGSLTAYASYATIFNPQNQLDANRQVLQPITGDNLEAGIKGAWFGNRLNASVALFQVHQKNTAESSGFDASIGQTLYRGVDARSQGIELDVGGQLAPGLQVSGGYTLMRLDGPDGQPVRTFVARNTGRLNVSYAPPAVAALKLGAALQYQSRIYLEPGALSTTTGRPVRLTQDGYATVDAFARYDLRPNLSLAVNVRNIGNAKYLTAINYDQGYYGAPRTVLGTISVRY